uniref:CUB domain-containing protein n=2 Tax=Scylla olivacea TaxID=85551 RepID=A0A0P4W3C7_SCYOL
MCSAAYLGPRFSWSKLSGDNRNRNDNLISEVVDVLLAVLLLSPSPPRALGQHDNKCRPDMVQGNAQTMEDKCACFSQPNTGDMEFYSPLFPNNYPNSTECVLRLEAKHGYFIRIDFRDYFDLEPSPKCEYDFLEVRDGAHGYSDLQGKYCGEDFPPIITSKGRYLWLRFTSDENIQYKGFRAVYSFMKNPEPPQPEEPQCEFEMSGMQGLISHDNITEERLNYTITYNHPIDCTWVVKVKPNEKIYVFFETFKLYEPNECDHNFVDIFGAGTDLRNLISHYCGSVADPLVSPSNLIHLRFFALERARETQFRAWFTSFRDSNQTEGLPPCTSREFYCDDATCIHKSLRCNGIKNCRNEYDEEDCNVLNNIRFNIHSDHIIIILTLGCSLLGGMCFAMCFNCIRKLIRDGRQIHENIRRSREQLEERSQRSQSLSATSSPQTSHRPPMNDAGPWYIADAKSNGHPHIRPESESESEGDDDEDEEELDDLEESCVEMRDCECQTRDSLITQRDSGQTQLPMTPPPPPPPNRRPPGLPLLSSGPPPSVPTPPPPPGTHYGRSPVAPPDHYGTYGRPPVPRHNDPYEVEDHSDTYSQRYRAEAVIEMKERGHYEPTKSPKTTPDVLATH